MKKRAAIIAALLGKQSLNTMTTTNKQIPHRETSEIVF